MNQLFKKIAIFLCVVMISPIILGCLPAVNSVSVAEAAAATKIDNTKVTIGIASTESIYLINKKSKANYTYSSSNKKVATVDKKGNVKAVAVGTAKITVSQTLNKKTTKIGTHTVTVKAASLVETKVSLGIGSSYYPYIDCPNEAAKYTYSSSDESVFSRSEDGNFYSNKAGAVTLTVNEIYKKKTKTIGTVEVSVAATSINKDSENMTIEVGSAQDPADMLVFDNQNYTMDADGNGPTYTYTFADPTIANIAEVYDDFWESYSTSLTGYKEGTTTMTVTENVKGESTVVGTVTITVVAASEW